MIVVDERTRAVDGSWIRRTVTRHPSGEVGSVERHVDGELVWGECGTPPWSEKVAAKAIAHPAGFISLCGPDGRERR